MLVRVLFVACIAAYPFLVLFGLKLLPASFFGIVLLVVLALRYKVLLPHERPVLLPVLIVFGGYALLAAVSGSATMLLYYPALVNFTLCVAFLNSLRYAEPLLLRFIKARGWPVSVHAPTYLWYLTVIWAAFFAFNGLVSIWTIFLGVEIWTLYNGFLSYCMVALLIGIEYVFRRWYKRSKGVEVQ